MDLDKFDNVMKTLVDYVFDETTFDDNALNIARFCLMDSLGCAIAASQDKDCINLLNSYRFSKSTMLGLHYY
jgi:2-methylcitrate dehydratase